MQLGKSADIDIFSPLHRGAGPEAALGAEGESSEIARQLEFDAQSPAPPAMSAATALPPKEGAAQMLQECIGTEVHPSKRQRVPTNVFEFEKPEKTKKPGREKLRAAKAGDTRVYNKSGLYSKDPLKAALAREKANLPPKQQQKKGGKGNRYPLSRHFARICV